MSGIVGILNLDGSPADGELLQKMTEFLAYRGPDAQEIWTGGAVGLGHAMLRTTRESLGHQQPASLDGQVWITADARVDARAELIQKLQSKGRTCHDATPDWQLILHAYHVWGEECVQHLLGDFVFALWDGPRRRLFCAHDHFGIKPFYYALVSDCLVFSNTLDCVRLHPQVSDRLNDLAVADFLLFNFNQDPATTTFADIQRLPAAHTLTWSGGAPRVCRYWTLTVAEPIHYRRKNDYVERFREVLDVAVEDRLRTDRVGVFMSGGLDSSTVAATAKRVLSRRSGSFELRAHTFVYDQLIPHKERQYSGWVAEALGIPIHYVVADGYTLFERWNQPGVRPPEPGMTAWRAVEIDHLRQAAAYGRVVLTGEGGDPALLPSVAYFIRQFKALRFGRVAWELGAYAFSQGRLPRVGFRTRLRRWMARGRGGAIYPTWLNPALEARLDLPARWAKIHRGLQANHAVRPEACRVLLSPYWQWTFESYDPGVTFSPVEVRHPFFDLRVMQYVLALPPMPWSVDKTLLREAARGVLPEQVRLRPKSPLVADPISTRLKHLPESAWWDHFEPDPALGQYVDLGRLPRELGGTECHRIWVDLRPLSLNLWLQAPAPFLYKSKPEGDDRESRSADLR